MTKNYFVLLLCFLTSFSHAAPLRTSKPVVPSAPRAVAVPETVDSEPAEESAPAAPSVWVEKPWALFGGVDAGLTNFSEYNGNLTTDASRSGSNLGVRIGISRYWQTWVADLALGWASINNEGKEGAGATLKVNTRTGFLDFSPRYRMSKKWQIGPELQYWLSSDDGSNPSIFSHESNHSAFGGLQLFYEWQGSTRYRLGGRILTDLNIEGRTANILQFAFQIGLGTFGDEENEVEERPAAHARTNEQVNESDFNRTAILGADEPLPVATPVPTPVATPAPVPVAALVPLPTPQEELAAPLEEEPFVDAKQEKVILTLNANSLPFAFDSEKLPASHQKRMRNLGAFLKKHQKAWKSLTVLGHTDEQGSAAYNKKLSKRRADSVRKYLIAGGAPASRIHAVGMGENKPRDRRHNEKAWAKNRRVELEFKGVKDIVIIRDALKK